VRPQPPNTSQQDPIRARRRSIRRARAARRLVQGAVASPTQDIIKNVDGPRGIFGSAMPVETGGRMIQRAPNDPRTAAVSIRRPEGTPGLWFMPGMTCRSGRTRALQSRAEDSARTSPTSSGGDRAGGSLLLHTHYDTVVGERSMGRAPRLQRDRLRLSIASSRARRRRGSTPCRKSHFTMGTNKWQTADTRCRARSRSPSISGAPGRRTR
jgi:hypothetical protein